MAGGFFHLRCARDLLDKLGRDHVRLQEKPDADTLFDFFVTAWSLHDWIKAERDDLNEAVRKLFENPGPLFHCREIGNKAKHFELTANKRPKPDPDARLHGIGGLNSSALNTAALNDGAIAWQLAYDGKVAVADVFHYADFVLDTLRTFSDTNDIEPKP